MSLEASTLVTTVGGASSNSYVTLAQFNTYCEQRLNVDAFDEAQADDKIRALLMATRRLDRENWQGARAASTQALAWPRAGVIKPDGSTVGGSIDSLGAGALFGYRGGYGIYATGYGEQYSSTEIPQPVKDAQCELALAYLAGYGASVSSDSISEFSVDGIRVKTSGGGTAGWPDAVDELIGGLIRGNRIMRA